MSDAIYQFIGRLHPMVLHLPIGLFAGLMIAETWWAIRKAPADRALRRVLVWMTAFAAGMTAAAGYILSEEPGYTGNTVTLHMWLGFAVVAVLFVAAVFASLPKASRAYALTLILGTAVLVPTGHFGASMTHGSDFLFEPFRAIEPPMLDAPPVSNEPLLEAAVPVDGNPQPAVVPSAFTTEVEPILAAYCLSCHGPTKQRGSLALHTPTDIFRGGKSGSLVVAGKPEESELYRRLVLPMEDEKHMPKAGKPQPSTEEIEAIRRWVEMGAAMEAGVKGAEPEKPTTVAEIPKAPAAPAIIEPSKEAIALLKGRLVHVEVIDPASRGLWIDFAGAAVIADAELAKLLQPLSSHVLELRMAGCDVGEATAAVIGSMPKLERLDLSRTPITIEQVRLIAAVKSLQRLTLVGNAGLTSEDVEGIRTSREPPLVIDIGGPVAAAEKPIETEPPVTFAKAGQAAAASAKLEPINAVCPVSGAPVDTKFAVLHEGKIVAFCCEKCAVSFWEDPAKFVVKAK